MLHRSSRRVGPLTGTLAQRIATACCAASAALSMSCDPGSTFTVSATSDEGSGSLRAAIAWANGEASTKHSALTIDLPRGTYELKRCGATDDNNARGDLDLVTAVPVTLRGEGQVVISQTCAGERVLDAHSESGLLVLRGVKLTGGSVIGGTPAEPARGGGVRAAGDVSLDGAVVAANSVTGSPGSVGDPVVAGGAAQGGGLFVGGSLLAMGSTLSENSCTGGAGTTAAAAYDPAAAGGSGEGGGAYVVGAITWTSGAVTNNTAAGGDGDGGGGAARGGGLAQASTSASEVSLSSGNFSSNRARGGSVNARVTAGTATGGAVAAAGALAATNINASNNSAVGGSNAFTDALGEAFAGVASGGALAVANGATVKGGTFSANQATSGNAEFSAAGCGGVWSPGFSGCTGSPPAAARGGAVWCGGTLDIESGEYSGNVATQGRGAISTGYMEPLPPGSCPPSQLPCPPGILRFRADLPRIAEGGAAASEGELSVDGGTYTGNDATIAPLTAESGFGSGVGAALRGSAGATIALARMAQNGGLYTVTSAVAVAAHLNLSGTQISGGAAGIEAGSLDALDVSIVHNQASALSVEGNARLRNATLTKNGGGVRAATLELDHATLYAEQYAYPLLMTNALTVHRSAVILEDGAICAANPAVTVVSSSYNWFTDTSCGLSGVGDRQDPNGAFLVQPLADNGGSLQTLLPDPASVLVDAIPASACSLDHDARGVGRPQGRGCDIGAVETLSVPGTGSTDLKLALSGPPAPVVPGTTATWSLRVTNAGPSASVPAVIVNVPAGVALTSATSARCSRDNPAVCRWTVPLAAGASETLTLSGQVAPDVTGNLVWRARVVAQQLAPPLEDDSAQLTTPVGTTNGVKVFFFGLGGMGTDGGDVGPYQSVNVYNDGPSSAVGTAERPIRIHFQRAAGVRTFPAVVSADFIGTIPPQQWAELARFSTFVTGPVPTRLGTMTLDPGNNALAGPAETPVLTSDIEVHARRTSGAQSAGQPVRFQIEATNRGSATEHLVEMELSSSQRFADGVTLSPSRGTLRPNSDFGFKWFIGSLAPGESAVIEATAPYLDPAASTDFWNTEPYIVATMYTRAFDFDFDDSMSLLDLSAAPRGVADLRISNVRTTSSSGTARTVEVTLTNAGPATALASSVEPIFVNFSHWAASARAIRGQWTCNPEAPNICRSTQSLAAGQTAILEFMLDSSMVPPSERPSFRVSSASLTPDPLPGNNAQPFTF